MMKINSIYKSLNIEDKEVAPVLLLIAQSIFIGIFYGAYDIGAHTLFLNVFPENMIPKAYIISGLVGITLTAIFSRAQSRLTFAKLANYSLIFISVCIVLLWLCFGFIPAKPTVFLVFIFFGPLNIIAVLAFWGTVGRIFNLRQGKRLFGIIDTGQIIGIIISSFGIPLVISFLHGTRNILLISALSIGMAMLLEVIISKRFNLDQSEKEQNVLDIELKPEEQQEQVKLKDYPKNPYLLYMALFGVFSMFAAFFVQYSFLVVTKERFPIEDEMAKYLGFFTGSMMVFTLVLKTFVYGKLLKTYGLKIGLILSPVLLGIFTLIAIISGYFGGYTVVSSGFIYFFLLISISKLFNKALKDSLEVPSFKLLYQALSKKIRFDVQAKIDGTINEISALTSGLILSGLSLLFFVKLVHYSVVLLFLLGLWTIITVKLYKAYRNNLEKSLQDSETKNTSASLKTDSELVKSLINCNSINQLANKLGLIYKYVPADYFSALKQAVSHHTTLVKELMTRKEFAVELFFLNKRTSEFKEFTKAINEFSYKPLKSDISVKELNDFFCGDNTAGYLSAIDYVMNRPQNIRLTILSSLLRFPNIETQSIAIRICGEIQEKETCGTLVEYLDSKDHYHLAYLSLLQMADQVENNLIQMFYKTDISVHTQVTILELLGKVKSKLSIAFLLDNLSQHRNEILVQSISSLNNLNFQATERERPRFFHPITQIIQTIAWDISALASLSAQTESPLYSLLNHEYHKHRQLLIDLLSVTYEYSSVSHVQDYLLSDTAEGIGYALELFDLFLSEEIKPIVMVVFDDINLVDKAKLLQSFFPVEINTPEQLILNIINRDPNLISVNIKRLAIKLYPQYYTQITNDIIAQLFSPVLELKIEAAKVIHQIAPDKVAGLLKRIQIREQNLILSGVNEKQGQDDDLRKIESFKKDAIELFSKYKINQNELEKYIDVEIIDSNKNIASPDVFCNYFVFLIGNLEDRIPNQKPELTDLNIYFEKFNDQWVDLIEKESRKFIIGIKNNTRNQLQLKNTSFVQNLLTVV